MAGIPERLESIQQRMAAAAARARRGPGECRLVAVSKTHPPEAVRAAFEAGQQVFGESRVQEAAEKIPLLPGAVQWHFVGHLQRNKVRRALPVFELFHGIDSLEIAEAVNRIAREEGLFPRVLIEVNVAGEGSKFGFPPERLADQLESLLALDRVQIDGLMTLPPPAADPEAARPHFAALRELRDRLAAAGGISLRELSMGMSGDFEVAVEEGATLVRVGTAIFGERPAKTAG